MKQIIEQTKKAIHGIASTMPTGAKVDQPSKGLTMPTMAQNVGKATTAPNTTTVVGDVDVVVIRGPEKDPNAEPPSVWSDLPNWVTSADL